MLRKLADMKKFIKKTGIKKKLIILLPKTKSVLEAAYIAYNEKYVDVIIIGNVDLVSDKIRQIPNLEIYDTENDKDAILKAISLVDKYKSSAILFKDDFDNDNFLKEIMNYKKTFLSFIHLAEFEKRTKLLAFTDTMINLYPNLKDKRKIIQNSVALMRKLGIEEPVVSVLSAINQISDKIPSSIDATLLAGMVNTMQIKNCKVNGPSLISDAIFDSANDILLFPNIDSVVSIIDLFPQLSVKAKVSILYGFISPVIFSFKKDSVSDNLLKIEFSLLL